MKRLAQLYLIERKGKMNGETTQHNFTRMVEDMGVTASMVMVDRGAWILVRYWEQLVWAKLNQLSVTALLL